MSHEKNKKEETIKQLKELLEHLKDKNTDGALTEACGKLHGIIAAFDDCSRMKSQR